MIKSYFFKILFIKSQKTKLQKYTINKKNINLIPF